MPQKQLTVATYAAGASLAAITLIYVFAPTYLIDSDSNSARKKGVVGLVNPANDCFINSVLQALAGLTDLRIYLIRENHRRNIDDSWVYRDVVEDPERRDTPEWKARGLQAGIVTKGLKEILDALNERPIYKKTISATGFVKVLESAFRQHISRQQQDAQEFLQVVAERLCDEYHAGRRARQAARQKGGLRDAENTLEPANGRTVEEEGLAELAANRKKSPDSSESATKRSELEADASALDSDDEDGFPMEGKYEIQIECKVCGFKPKPKEESFCTLTLSVPQSSSASLNTCLDGFFKTEYVDDFKCEKCRLKHARDLLRAEMSRSNSDRFKATTREAIAKLQHAIDTDPENPPSDVVLPDRRYAPKCRIARHTRLTSFPKILAIHLSRSIYDASHLSQKNSAKVSFPEQLPMGGLLNSKKYKLLGTVTHKGSHHSGHYESFRRQNVSLPYATTNAFQPSSIFTKSATPSPASTPQVSAIQKSGEPSPIASTPDLIASLPRASSSNSSVNAQPRHSGDTMSLASPTSNGQTPSRLSRTATPRERDPDSISFKSVTASARSTISRISQSARNSRPSSPTAAGKTTAAPSTANETSSGVVNEAAVAPSPMSKAKAKKKVMRRRKHSDRWWRISDEKIKEAKTSEVLGMQREVYLLFYELERKEERAAAESAS